MRPALVVLAAGMSTRYGRPKQLEPVGPSAETLLDYGLFDARRAGFGPVVLVIRQGLEPAMRSHISAGWRDLEVRYAFQEVDPGRRKPWGTAHAILSASRLVASPFGVCNADDFYGTDAFAALAAHLSGGGGPALVAYRLEDTLSPHGGVSRAVCETDRSGRLTALTELHEVRAAGGAARGVETGGRAREVALDAPVSMNLWGFTPAVLPLLEQGFARFAERHRSEPETEYPLSTAVHELVTAGRITVTVLARGEGWMGITHPDDRKPVAARLRALVEERRYPSPLLPPGGGTG